MISKLIVNADDLGYSADVTHAIVKAHEEGVVTSTTLFANCDANILVQAQEIARTHPKLGIGVHLVLTTREPVLKTHKTLVNGLGMFRFRDGNFDDTVDLDEVYREWKAQIERIQAVIPITHFDSHKHVHMHPQFQTIARRLSKEFKLPMRWNKAKKYAYVYCVRTFHGQDASIDNFKNIVENHHGLVEIMTHPGFMGDVFLDEISGYSKERYNEYQVLTSEALKTYIQDQNIELVNYKAVKKNGSYR